MATANKNIVIKENTQGFLSAKMLADQRSDLRFVPIRGNIDTRLKLVGKEVEHMTIKWWLCTPLIMKRILGKSTKFYFDCRSSRSF